MHLAVILDGNRRFAKKNGMSIEEGYRIAAERVEEFFRWFYKRKDVKILSLYALSMLNFKNRPKSQIKCLINLFYKKLKNHLEEVEKYKGRYCVKIVSFIKSEMPKKLRDLVDYANREFSKGERKIYFLFGYDSETELENALRLSKINGKPLRENLLVKEPVDLLVRTGNEKRLSGFLLYQASQAQIYFEKRMFPETNKHVWNYWIRWFNSQERRFGR